MIDPAALLAPVPGDVPQGIDPRNPSHPLWSELRSAWSRVRQKEDRGDTETRADWAEVERQAAAFLVDVSKDLQVAAYLSEALIYTDGFEGLAAGGILIAGLMEHFSESAYPVPDEDEPHLTADDTRLEQLSYLADHNGRLLPAVRRVVLFTLDDGTAFTYPDCQTSKAWTELRPEQRTQQLGRLSPQDRMERERTAGNHLWDAVQQAVRADRPGALTARHRAIVAAIDAWRGAAAVVENRLGEGRFVIRPLIDLLGDVLRTVEELVPAMPQPTDPPQAGAETAAATPASPAPADRRLDNREDALRQLGEITAFFRRTEPHSPLAYTLEDAVRRARLSWPEWLEEVVPDQQQRQQILMRLGISQSAGTS